MPMSLSSLVDHDNAACSDRITMKLGINIHNLQSMIRDDLVTP